MSYIVATVLCFHKKLKEEYLVRPFMRLQQPRTLLKNVPNRLVSDCYYSTFQ